MKISFAWLKKLIQFNQTPDEVAELLTSSGLEVESIEKVETIKGGLKGMVIGEVVEKSKHPDADKLSLTKVNVGGSELLDIVCGAPNVAAGQKVVVATVGAKLFPTEGEPFVIKKSKIRGAVSEGMLCAEDEIGLGKSHAGIMVLDNEAKVGMPASEYFKIEEDVVFEIGLTPNRGDAASHYGVARELATILNCIKDSDVHKAEVPGINNLPDASGTWNVSIEVENQDACKRYCGLVITGIKIGESPEWLKNSLNSIGVRPINNIVDITNYVLHETGQPLHAFDAFKISGKKVVVRSAGQGEKIVLLDGTERELTDKDLMICDEVKPMCLAGVFGGLNSGVSNETTAIFLESAYFSPDWIRASSRRHGLKTDASFRFERGTDPDMVHVALKRATNLILEIVGGNIACESIDVYPNAISLKRIAFSYKNCFDLIGKEIPKTKVKNILTSLGMQIVTEGNDGLLIDVPPFKADVTREADVCEEILRIYGYNNVESSGKISFSSFNTENTISFNLENKISDLLVSLGFHEIMNTSLSKEEYYNENKELLVPVLNPISSDLRVLRKNMLFSGLESIAYNNNRKNSDLKLFEFGRVYSKNNQAEKSFPYLEERRLAIFICGRVFNENPYGQNKKCDFQTIKTYFDAIIEKTGVNKISSTPIDNDADISFGLEYNWKNKPLARLGKVSKKLAEQFDIKEEVFYSDFNWDLLQDLTGKNKIEFQEIPKFPSVRRDLALLLDKKVQYKQIIDLSFSAERKFLKDVNLFDIYEGDRIDSNKKSYAISFTLQDNEATLTDLQTEKIMDKLLATFKEKLGAEIR